MKSKHVGKVFDNYEVVYAYRVKDYKTKYGKDSKPRAHSAYNFILYNDMSGNYLKVSGNTLRLLSNGSRNVSDMLNTKARSSRNSSIRYLIEKRRLVEKRRKIND